MKGFRKIWNSETDGFLVSRKPACGVDYGRLLEMFLKEFPKSGVTEAAIRNRCSQLKLCRSGRHPGSPLYSERIKKGYVRIKVAEPNVWVSKAQWVYQETHPWEDFTERSCYIFLNGDNRDFSPSNIERIPTRIKAPLAKLGGCAKGDPDTTRLRIARARLRCAILDAGERLGMVATYCGTRGFKDDFARRTKEYYMDPDRRAERNRKALERYRRKKESGGKS